jgi:S1-C subfamily serine protease
MSKRIDDDGVPIGYWIALLVGIIVFSTLIIGLIVNSNKEPNVITSNTDFNTDLINNPNNNLNNDILSNNPSSNNLLTDSPISENNRDEIIKKMKDSIVWVKYEVTGKNQDGSYLETGGSGSGVIFNYTENKLSIYTNRHVIDCKFNTEMDCYQRLSEKISVRLQDGTIYPVERVVFAPHNLDIAILEVYVSDYENNTLYVNNDINIGDKVTAIGYPSYSTPNNDVLEFSIADGTINNIKDLLMNDGFAFNSIVSDVYTYFGSSGGGLFDNEGNLVGINTWINTENKESIAIKINAINGSSWSYCGKDSYMVGDYCINYCNRDEILDTDNGCYKICDSFYCGMNPIIANDSRCKNTSNILGNDGYCHQPCGSVNQYCSDSTSICYKNNCVSCSSNTYLYKNGTCRVY